MSRFKLLDRLRGSVLAGSVGTSASEDKLLSSRESHPGVIPAYPGLKLLIELSGLCSAPCRRDGSPLPWMNYALIHFLSVSET